MIACSPGPDNNIYESCQGQGGHPHLRHYSKIVALQHSQSPPYFCENISSTSSLKKEIDCKGWISSTCLTFGHVSEMLK